MNKLYSNIDKKLRTLAVICGVIGIICFGVGLLVELGTLFDVFNGLFLLGCGILGLLCLISSWPLYAFAQLVDDIHQMKANGVQAQNTSSIDELPEL